MNKGATSHICYQSHIIKWKQRRLFTGLFSVA